MGCNFSFDEERWPKEMFHVSVEDGRKTSPGMLWVWDSSAACWFRVFSKAQYDSAMFKEQ